MSNKVTIFNPHQRPVPYSTEGFMLAGLAKADADPTDPVCALALEHGHLKVLAPQQTFEVANSEVVTTEPLESSTQSEVVEVEAPAEAEEVHGEADEAKPTRKKSATQASKE